MDMGLPAFPARISEDVQHAIDGAMQPRRKDRPQDINAFLEMLPQEDSSNEDDVTVISVHPEEIPESVNQPVSPKNRLLFSAALALFLGSVILAGVSFYQKGHSDSTSPDKARVEALENEVSALTTKNNSLQKQVNDMKGQVSSSTQNKSALQKQVDDLTRKNGKCGQ